MSPTREPQLGAQASGGIAIARGGRSAFALRAPAASLVRRVRMGVRMASQAHRGLPGVLIIGAQKAGTKSLFTYLANHPRMAASCKREVHYFDLNYHRGLPWYRSHFPPERALQRIPEGGIAFEASPYYLAHPLAPYRVRGLLPTVKLLVLLRDPVARAVSHYHHAVRHGDENLPLEDAIARERERLERDLQLLETAPLHEAEQHRLYSYLERGHYAHQLETWLSLFDRRQIRPIKSELLFEQPAETMAGVFEFLGLESQDRADYPALGKATYQAVAPGVATELRAHFSPHNARLRELLGEEFSWD